MLKPHPVAGRAGVTASLAAPLAAALVVAGCSNSGGNQNKTGPTSNPVGPTSSTSSTTSKSPAKSSTVPAGGLPAGVTQGPLPSTVANNIVKRKSVTINKCRATANGYESGGTVTNSSGERKTYHITIFFTTTQATVLSYARTTVTVRNGATKTWSASAKFRATKTMDCVLRGVG